MLEGLEAIEILYKTSILTDNETLRYDSEYFLKNLLFNVDKLKKLPHTKLSLIADVKGGKRLPLGDEFTEYGVRYIRAEDVKNSFVQYKNSPFISEKTHSEIAIYQTSKDDVLLTIVGNSIGDIGLVKFELDKCNLTENCVKITSKKNEFNSNYLFLFFMSHYGQIQIMREKVGTAQPKLAIERIRRFLIPVVSYKFQEKISDILDIANNLLLEKDNIYTQAENLLTETLGMANFTPSNEPISIKSFKNSFGATGRLDAEYYQPKYEKFEQFILNGKLKHTTIKAQFSLVKESSKRLKQQYQYVEIGDVNVSDGKATASFIETNELPANAKIEAKYGDILISKVRPNRGAIAIIDFDDTDLIVSGAFTVLRAKSDGIVSAETLKVLLRTSIYREWLLKFNVGTSYPVIKNDDVLDLPIPIVDFKIQRQIADLVQQSFKLKAHSEQLLNIAKRAVEIAIEENEAAATAWIDDSIKNIEDRP